MKQIKSTAVPIPIENIDTDQIIPARFLKATTREGFGENLFRDWRYDARGLPQKDFVLNDPTHTGEILIAGRNFGCGSSREHAAWALVDYGFRVVVSSFFADIFKSNALNNYLLPIQVTDDELQQLFEIIEQDPQAQFIVDLHNQILKAECCDLQALFEISPYKKMCLLEGFDDTGYLINNLPAIETFENNQTGVFENVRNA